MRIAIPYPCIGCSSSVFRISMSSVPCTSPLALSAIRIPAPLDNPEEHRTRTLDCQEEGIFRPPAPPVISSEAARFFIARAVLVRRVTQEEISLYSLSAG